MMKANAANLKSRYTQVIAGIQTRMASVASVVLVGVTYSPADLVKLFQSWLTADAAVVTAQAQFHAAVQNRVALGKTVHAVYLALQQYARLQYGQAPDLLGAFGFAPEKQAAKSPAVLVAAAQKGVATRKARHTMGSNQKKAITGAPAPAEPTSPAAPPATKSS